MIKQINVPSSEDSSIRRLFADKIGFEDIAVVKVRLLSTNI